MGKLTTCHTNRRQPEEKENQTCKKRRRVGSREEVSGKTLICFMTLPPAGGVWDCRWEPTIGHMMSPSVYMTHLKFMTAVRNQIKEHKYFGLLMTNESVEITCLLVSGRQIVIFFFSAGVESNWLRLLNTQRCTLFLGVSISVSLYITPPHFYDWYCVVFKASL